MRIISSANTELKINNLQIITTLYGYPALSGRRLSTWDGPARQGRLPADRPLRRRQCSHVDSSLRPWSPPGLRPGRRSAFCPAPHQLPSGSGWHDKWPPPVCYWKRSISRALSPSYPGEGIQAPGRQRSPAHHIPPAVYLQRKRSA